MILQAKILHSIYNDDGPICGGAFLNYTCTEFCTVVADSVNVKFYLKWENDDETTEAKPKEGNEVNEQNEQDVKLGKEILV